MHRTHNGKMPTSFLKEIHEVLSKLFDGSIPVDFATSNCQAYKDLASSNHIGIWVLSIL